MSVQREELAAGPPERTPKRQYNLRMSAAACILLGQLATQLGVSRAAVVELAIRGYARQQLKTARRPF